MRRIFWHHRRPGLRIERCRGERERYCAGFACGAFGRGPDAGMIRAVIRVALPAHLRTLARVGSETNGELQLEVEGEVTQRTVLDALEARYPMLRGTLRDH